MPIIAAGGMLDGPTMAAAFALGAEGIQMGTRMVSALESPVHENWKQAIVAAAETDTVFLNRSHGPGLRALRTERTEQLEQATHNVMSEFGDRANVLKLYFGGDLEAALALSGQVAGRIDAVRPVAEVIRETRRRLPRAAGAARGALSAGSGAALSLLIPRAPGRLRAADRALLGRRALPARAPPRPRRAGS